MEGRSSHDGGRRRGTDDEKAPGAGKRRGRRRERGRRSSNGPETTGEPSYPLAQGGDKEETSPTEATEKEATEVSASDYFLQTCCLLLAKWEFSFFFYGDSFVTFLFKAPSNCFANTSLLLIFEDG